MKIFLTLKYTLLVSFAILILTACGGGGSSGSDGNSAADNNNSISDDPKTIPEFSNFLNDRFGEKGSFDAVMLSLDKGYQFDQIFSAGKADRLNTDGTISDGLGGTETPLNLPYDYFSVSSSTTTRADPAAVATLDRLRAQAKNAAARLDLEDADTVAGGIGLLLILMLAEDGFSTDQIITGLVDGTISQNVERDLFVNGRGPELPGTKSKGFELQSIETPKAFYEDAGTVECDTFVEQDVRLMECVHKDGADILDLEIRHTYTLRPPAGTGGVYIPGNQFYIDVTGFIEGYSFCCSIGESISAYFDGKGDPFKVTDREGAGMGTLLSNGDLPATGNTTVFETERSGQRSLKATLTANIPASQTAGEVLTIELFGAYGNGVVTYKFVMN